MAHVFRRFWATVALLSACVLPALGWAQQEADRLSSEERTKTICEVAAKHFAQLKSKDAFARLAPYWPIAGDELQALSNDAQAQLELFERRFGKPLGAEWVNTQTAGKSLLRHNYLVKFENHAVRLQCVFYKPKDWWMVSAFLWDDQLDRLFQ